MTLERIDRTDRAIPLESDQAAFWVFRLCSLAVLDAAIDIADPARPLRRQLHAAIEHLRDDDYVLAGPPLVTAVEGLWWEAAIEKGAIDKTTRSLVAGERAGKKATSAHDVFDAMPLNDRVKEKLDRYAFGGEANAFRHGQEGDWGIRTQCAIWLLALIAWMDGHGWRRFDPADARLLSLTHPSGVHLVAGRSSAWMRMCCAKQRARAQSMIALPATEQFA